ncbi:uncharacterized protein A4U43_C02F22340 [Asparagus officinalis]|uniref:ABC transporter domain-containing protein n=1 Tax=Asparagus officinalis TaxID=4686 RepID=A0A5P1FQ05_ASPOF|nr:pleiotropic drug resistance protein 2-like [Asparagus officinalis]ONK78781.1 uncharacterized protein A4U43_C02F22340 [Asparagus officinalis]
MDRPPSRLRSWASFGIHDALGEPETAGSFGRRIDDDGVGDGGCDDEEELKWAAIEKLPTYSRARRGVLLQEERAVEVDFERLGSLNRRILIDSVLRAVEEDNGRLLRRLRARIDGVGIELPTVEVRFEKLSVEGDAYVESRALPTLVNATLNTVEGILRLSTSKKRTVKILSSVSGIVRPSRMTLLLGPPGSGKTTLLLALAGRLNKKLGVSGKITYCGHEFPEFIPERTSVYISQHDLHNAEMTVRETLDFSGCCLGVGTNYDMLLELLRREKAAGIKPDPEIDAFMKVTSLEGQHTNLVTDYVLKILGLDICADTIVGNEMLRGISGGQKKRVTIGEMLVGPAKVLFMDEISTGLDSSTTFQIVKFLRQMVHVMDCTMILSLLQPSPETFNLFDDIILLSEGQIVYQGPRDRILEFFEGIGFKCPERKDVADFLQEVTSKKDQEQYWFNKTEPYRYISVPEIVQNFSSFTTGEQLREDLRIPYDKCCTHPAALADVKYGTSRWKLFRACFSREWLLIKRNSFLYIFKTTQIAIMSVITMILFLRTQMYHETIADGGKYLSALFFSLVNMMFNGMAELQMTVRRLPVFYKQRDYYFYPPWAFGLSMWILRIPLSVLESGIWVSITYYGIGFAPAANRFFAQFLAYFFIHQMALALFRLLATVGRTPVIASTIGRCVCLLMFVLGGFLISKDNLLSWLTWGYWISPITYAQNAISINEFLDNRWSIVNNDTTINASTVGKAFLKSRGMQVKEYWYWISIGALAGFSLFFNVCSIAALTYLNPFGSFRTVINGNREEPEGSSSTEHMQSKMSEMSTTSVAHLFRGIQLAGDPVNNTSESVGVISCALREMPLTFQPLSLSFDHVNYYVEMPKEMKSRGIEESRLQLLHDVSGTFMPGVLTALVGVSGAGKTTLMDVLAGRKTTGYTEGTINISGYPKSQETFARVSGYCEQNDIHSPNVTVHESLIYSAWLRLGPDVNFYVRKMFVDEVMDLIELNPLKNALVGLPGVYGLSTEQRKRLTIAVELVANPSIIFMDEPTTGLDARAAAIIMRTVRNTVNTGRTVICTIHQPSIDIFESFDELLLMKRGGQVIYAGALGHKSEDIIKYFEAIPGVPKIKDGYNPATWALEISSPSVEARLGIDFAEVYANSSLYKKNQKHIKELSSAAPGPKDLYFLTRHSQSFRIQYMACLWKQHLSYWRNPQHNGIRFLLTIAFGLIFGVVFWNTGNTMKKQQDLFNIMGAMYASIFFLGGNNATAVQSVVLIERVVFYREKATGMYSALPYALALVSIEILYVAVQSLLYGVLLFFMLGFSWQVEKLFWFIYFNFMCFVTFTLCGMMLLALTSGLQLASILMAFFSGLWSLFSGFIVPKPLAPIWLRWYYWASPAAWILDGIMTSQFGDLESLLEIPGQASVPVKVFLKNSFGYEYEFLKHVALLNAAFAITFFFVFTFSIKVLNFQKR